MQVPINDDDLQEKDECFHVDFSVLDGPLSISKSTFGPTQLKINVIENDGVSIYCAVCVVHTHTVACVLYDYTAVYRMWCSQHLSVSSNIL